MPRDPTWDDYTRAYGASQGRAAQALARNFIVTDMPRARGKSEPYRGPPGGGRGPGKGVRALIKLNRW